MTGALQEGSLEGLRGPIHDGALKRDTTLLMPPPLAPGGEKHATVLKGGEAN
jgi:hypothetical protein